MPELPSPVATVRLAHSRRRNHTGQSVTVKVRRPATGAVIHPVVCPTCEEEFTVEVHSLESIRDRVRPRRLVRGGALLALAVALLAAAVAAYPNISLTYSWAGVAVFLAVVAVVHLAGTRHDQGLGTLRRAADDRALPLAGFAGHFLF